MRFVDGRYEPAGNILDAIPGNVQKGNFDSSYCNSVTLDQRKYFDKHGKAAVMGTPFTKVGVPDVKIRASPRTPPQGPIELLNSKKKKAFLGHNDR